MKYLNIKKELTISIPKTNLTKKDTSILSDMIGVFYKDSEHTPNLISSISNEILTNGFKYSKAKSDIKINTFINDECKLCIIMENECTKTQAKQLSKFISYMTSTKDYDKLYLDRLNFLTKHENESKSQIGIISLINMYDCFVDIKIYDESNHHCVTTIITMNV